MNKRIPFHSPNLEGPYLEEFAQLSRYWLETGCDSGQPCREADWDADGVVDLDDLVEFTECRMD